MTTIELLVHCKSRGPKLRIPDLLWQRHMHLEENLKVLCDDDCLTPPDGFHDMCICILEPRSGLIAVGRHYATILFGEGPTCNKQQT